MPYRIADDSVVVDAARRVLRDAKSIQTQRDLRRRVLEHLQGVDPTVTVGEERLRRLVARQPFVRLELAARKGARDRVLTRCPVCENALQRLKNQTLFGGEVTITLRCPACGYWTGKEKRVPTRYTFHYEPKGAAKAPDNTAQATNI